MLMTNCPSRFIPPLRIMSSHTIFANSPGLMATYFGGCPYRYTPQGPCSGRISFTSSYIIWPPETSSYTRPLGMAAP